MWAAVNGRWLRAGPLLRRGPYAHTTCSSLALLRRPSAAAALHSRAGPNPRQINALIKDATLARELLGLHEQHGQSFNDVNLATCWSRLGRMRGADRSWLRSDDGTALRALREQTTDQVRTLGARELSNAAHAIAKLDFRGAAWGGLWKEIEGAALARRSELNPQALANTAWAFATAGRATTALFDAIGKEAAGRVRDFEPQHLANTAWAFATAGHAAPALFDAIGREAAGRVHELNPQDLSNTAWAFATAGHAAPALFDAIGKEAAGRVRELNPQDISNTAWAFATAGHPAPALFDTIGKEAAGRMRELKPQELANTAWAFAVLDHLPSESSLFDQGFAHQCDALAHEFNSLNLSQLHQWRLWYASERACSDALPGPALLARCDAAFRSQKVQASRTQGDVTVALASLGVWMQEEKVLEEGYSLDVVVDNGGEVLIAIEVDGPSHFVGRVPTASTLLKRRQLKYFGWPVVSVPYWEWDEQNHRDRSKQHEQRAAYLTALLSSVDKDVRI